MSMPCFPEEALGITCEQAFNMLLGSIAMEELALSHILNAEGEKLQYVLGTLPGKPCPCSTPKEILEVNRSISDLLERVAYNQTLLKGKLQQVLESRAQHCPPAAACPPQPACGCVWTAVRGRPWSSGCALPWRREGGRGKETCWQGCSPGLIHLCPQHTYLLSLSLRVRACQAGPVRAVLQEARGCSGETLLLCEACAHAPDAAVQLSGCTVLAPLGAKPAPSPLQLVLEQPDSVLLEQGVLHLVDMDG